MSAANVASIYAVGCGWAGIDPRKPFVVDMDFEAPGVQYYDFLKFLASLPNGSERLNYEVRGERFSNQRDLLSWLGGHTGFGLLHWINGILGHRDVRRTLNTFLPSTFAAKNPVISSKSLLAVEECVKNLLLGSSRDVDPCQHVITVRDSESGKELLGMFPAGQPEQREFQQELRDFSWRRFVDNAGYSILSALYWYLLSPKLSYQRILLDQDAGASIPSIANRAFAHSRVIVTGFNQQNRDSLFGMIDSMEGDNMDDVRVILSQYSGRQIVRELQIDPISEIAYDPLLNLRVFHEEEDRRLALTNGLKDRGIPREHVFLIDFIPDAVQKEHFHRRDSTSWNEFARMLVSIERGSLLPAPAWCPVESIRLIGEFVGVEKPSPSGAIGALRLWLKSRLGESSVVSGIATEHELLARMVEVGGQRFNGVKNSDLNRDHLGVRMAEDDEKRGEVFRLSDFDIVALPAYLLPHIVEQVEDLGFEECSAYSDDRVGPADENYYRTSVLGFEKYGYYPTDMGLRLVGYPLFVDYQVLVANKASIVGGDFKKDYFEKEQRRFRGFPDPGDVLSAARAAKESDVPQHRLIMTLEDKHIAQWYEWQTLVALFGGRDFDGKHPHDDLAAHNRLTDAETVRATRFYLELSSYASKDSENTAWDKAIKLFYEDKKVGMAFVFPDAIPLEYRIEDRDSPFVYAPFPSPKAGEPASQPYPEECWLLVVPKGRRSGAPLVGQLRQLLAEFLTYDNQVKYQSFGGLTPHKRVLELVDLWHTCPFLPLLSRLNNGRYVVPRNLSLNARSVANQIVIVLDGLHKFVRDRLKGRDDAPDVLWHKKEFVEELEKQIKLAFEGIKF